MATTFTKDQLSAIETTDKTLLVSAGAGAGKTATLTERIIRQLLDKDTPGDISRMLIATFTKAAVAELKERIHKAIKTAIKETGGSEHLERQLHILPAAKIATIDSFCNDIFKNNAERLGISPKYRIADPIEAAILARTVCTSLIGAIYDGNVPEVMTPEELTYLSDSLSSVKSENSIEDVFLKLYFDSQSLITGVDIFDYHKERYNRLAAEPQTSPDIAYAMEGARNMAKYHIGVMRKIIPLLIEDDIQRTERLKAAAAENPMPQKKKKEKTSPQSLFIQTFDEDIRRCEAIISADSYETVSAILSAPFGSAPSVGIEETPALVAAQSTRKAERADFADFYSRFFNRTLCEWGKSYEKLSDFLDKLSRFLHKFDEIYFGEKRTRAILEYSDIERLAHKSLYNEDGTLTDYALAERELYDCVYIDEYQDVNDLQDSIFKAVSKENNCFMVGDIKQSIYGFRGASADIFRKMKGDFPPLSNSDLSNTASIFMSENFRCDRGIINFVNATFDRLFSLRASSIGYVSEDKLECSKYKGKNEPPFHTPVLKIFTGEDSEDLEKDEASELSARYVAKKIRELTSGGTLADGTPITPGKIAILFRKDAGRAAKYKAILESEGIKAETGQDKTFFFNAEIELMLCLLNSIDNPHRDIYLAGLMLSPLYSFTADELVRIRKTAKAPSLWQSLILYSEENEGFIKGISFIRNMKRYRALAEGMATDELIIRLYNETGLLSLASRHGKSESLMLLYNYARDFEGSSFKGLYNFINYINTAISRGASFGAKKSDSGEDAVTITTIHNSKGLEYPVVFIAEAGADLLSKMDKKLPYRYLEKAGFSAYTRAKEANALIENPIYNILDDMIDERAIDEELRVYYVAFTRAREYLYIVGKSKKESVEKLLSSQSLMKDTSSPFALRKMGSLIDLVIFAGKNYELDTAEDECETEAVRGYVTNEEKGEERAKEEDTSEKPNLGSLIAERIAYEYPTPYLTTLPEKMSISKVYPTVLDGTDENIVEIINTEDETKEKTDEKRRIIPEFIEKNKIEESKRRGIATHMFMQFFNIERLILGGAKAELSFLSENGYITKEDTERVRLREIELFTKSPLLSEMRNAKHLYREFRFNVKLPAPLFTADEEKKKAYEGKEILLQGVIDCIIEDKDGNLHLIDYKTDRLSEEELSDKALAKEALAKKHSLQLYYYSLAIEKIFEKLPKTKRVYSLALGDCIYLD